MANQRFSAEFKREALSLEEHQTSISRVRCAHSDYTVFTSKPLASKATVKIIDRRHLSPYQFKR